MMVLLQTCKSRRFCVTCKKITTFLLDEVDNHSECKICHKKFAVHPANKKLIRKIIRGATMENRMLTKKEINYLKNEIYSMKLRLRQIENYRKKISEFLSGMPIAEIEKNFPPVTIENVMHRKQAKPAEEKKVQPCEKK